MDNARCHRKTAREIESRQTDKTDGQTEKKVQDSRTWVEDKHTEGDFSGLRERVDSAGASAEVVKRLVVKKETFVKQAGQVCFITFRFSSYYPILS